jgi:hypothetical protein
MFCISLFWLGHLGQKATGSELVEKPTQIKKKVIFFLLFRGLVRTTGLWPIWPFGLNHRPVAPPQKKEP